MIQIFHGVIVKQVKSNGKSKGKLLLAALVMGVPVTAGFISAAARLVVLRTDHQTWISKLF